jgi:hypothetical protein
MEALSYCLTCQPVVDEEDSSSLLQCKLIDVLHSRRGENIPGTTPRLCGCIAGLPRGAQRPGEVGLLERGWAVPHDIAYARAATTATPSSRTRTIAAKVPVAFITVPIGTGEIAATITSPDVTPPADPVTVTTSPG